MFSQMAGYMWLLQMEVNIFIICRSIKTAMSLTDFVILAKIGEGAFSSVHKVKRISDGKIYGLKKVKISNLKEKEKENSLNEVRILASINSPNIIGYKEAFFDEKSNTLCIVMEFADGGDLEKVISKRKKNLSWTPENQVWSMAKQVLSGLLILHEMNIIHRDIKCANIFISEGIYKLGDMNVSKLMKQSLAYTQTGTPYYASPEVWNDKPYELKSDIWSIGCIVYEFCSLRPPFTANSMEGLFKKVMKGVYPRIPVNYSENLEKFIKRCLQLESKNRPTCKELLAMIPTTISHPVSESNHTTSINLLSTIKVPRNMQSWRDELPKSNYLENTQIEIEQKETRKNRFGHLSQQKLRDIVRQKNPEISSIIPPDPYKKNSIKRITPDISSSYGQEERRNFHQESYLDQQRQNQQLLRQNLQKYRQEQAKQQNSSTPKQKIQRSSQLPQIKVHSEPNDLQASSVQERLREEQRNRRYNYNRPVWWG